MAEVLQHLGQVLVASGEQRHEEAIQRFQQALELATAYQMAPIALDVCVGVAQLLAQAEDVERAFELLALAEQHEASTFETKEKAQQLLAELVGRVPPEMDQGQVQELWDTVQNLLAELEQ